MQMLGEDLGAEIHANDAEEPCPITKRFSVTPQCKRLSTSLLQSNDCRCGTYVVEVNDYLLTSETLHAFPHVVRRADLL
jgi:hypothetical protein